MLFEIYLQTASVTCPWLESKTKDPSMAKEILQKAKTEYVWLRVLDSRQNVVFLQCQKKGWDFSQSLYDFTTLQLSPKVETNGLI